MVRWMNEPVHGAQAWGWGMPYVRMEIYRAPGFIWPQVHERGQMAEAYPDLAPYYPIASPNPIWVYDWLYPPTQSYWWL